MYEEGTLPSIYGVKAERRMALVSVLRTRGVRGALREFWRSFSATLIGDMVATAVALTAMCALFLACSFAVIGFSRGAGVLFHLLGAR